MHHQWLADLAKLCADAVPCVLVTVTEAKGSTPREAGAKMLVTATAQFGTIGGGNLEFEATAAARDLLQQRETNPVQRDYALGPRLAQCCGGAVSVLLEPFFPTGKKLLLFGAGHVGREVVGVLSGLPVDIRWIDSRAQEFPDALPAACRKIVTAQPLAELRDLDDGSHVVVMTHNHDLDYEIVRDVLKGGRFAYLGLIGSATKRARFEKRLLAEGIAPEALHRLVCPLGIAGITGKHPREIAVALAAEFLALGLTRP